MRMSYRRPACYCPQSRPAARVAYALPMSYERCHPAPVPPWRERLGLYGKLTRGDRPIGWLLLLWPTWCGPWIAAGGLPPWWTLVVFTLGVWLTRSAGGVTNDYADRSLDPQVARKTASPLAPRAVRAGEARELIAVLERAA